MRELIFVCAAILICAPGCQTEPTSPPTDYNAAWGCALGHATLRPDDAAQRKTGEFDEHIVQEIPSPPIVESIPVTKSDCTDGYCSVTPGVEPSPARPVKVRRGLFGRVIRVRR